MIRPTESRYAFPIFHAEPNEGEGASPATTDGRSLGGAFTGMLASMGQEAPERPEPIKPESKAAKAPVEKPTAKAPESKADSFSIPEGVLEPATDKAPESEPDFDAMASEMKGKSGDNFKKLRAASEAKLKKLSDELAEAKKAGAAAGEINSIKSELEQERKTRSEIQARATELEEVVQKIALERSPEFQKKYVVGRNEALKKALDKVSVAGGDADAFSKALTLTGRAKFDAMESALVDVPDFARAQIAQFVDKIEELDSEKAEKVTNHRESLEKFQREEMERRAAEDGKLAEFRSNRFGELVPKMAESVMMVRQIPPETPGAEEWNKRAAQIVEGAQALLFKESNFDSFTAAAIKGQAYDHLEVMFRNAHAEIANLKGQVKALTASEPGTSNGGGGSRQAAANEDESGKILSLGERWARAREANG